MALFKNDVSEYVTSGRFFPVRLVVAFTPVNGSPDRYSVTARVDDDDLTTESQFVANPEWLQSRSFALSLPTSKVYWTAPSRTAVGNQLFSALFSGALSRCWAQAVERGRQRGLHIIIRSSSYAVQSIPWELLSDPALTSSEFVTFSDGWSVLRDIRVPRPDSMPDIGILPDPVLASDMAILVMTTAIGGLNQNSDPEIIREAFPKASVKTVPDASSEQIIDELGSDAADVAHFLGTGKQVRQGRQELLVGTPDHPDVVPRKSLVKALEDSRRLRLLVLAACETDQLAAHLASVVPAVIGIRGMISDAGCQAFLGGLYVALASGATLSQAVASGRTQQIGFSQSFGDEWAQPVLFLNQDGPIVSPASPARDSTTAASELRDPESQAGTPEERTTRLLLEIAELNLNALREQWGKDKVQQPDIRERIPAFVQEQIDRFAQEVDTLRGPGR
ncbi:CHAT domain-containing protein [Arthrobacter sp. AK04]|uniref:CHAT domain-containing protein n=1 Tax=Arthrobacter sp. AK04 TaxID=2900048 RepID=UPI001E2F5560|nr:CHAT domain-containing protein [Arthrobacter sp. AK04]MCD5341534.1 CHAT domain-containing protein [Arthrobacter sp. AK04]